jgi:hypothetical protein
VSVSIIKAMSLMPIAIFHRLANMTLQKEARQESSVLQYKMVRTSTFFNDYSYHIVPKIIVT